MSFRRACLLFGSLAILGFALSGYSQISKGNQLLLNRGLQLQGLSQDDCYLHLDTFSNANYTSINWDNAPGAHSSRPDWMGAAPGFPWARWASDETQMPPQITPYGGDEAPYLGQLLALQLGDEWNLLDDATRTRLVDWFNAVRTNFPNTMLYHNNWGSQIDDAHLADFYTRAQPDMLCFDTYPWQSIWDINAPDHIGAPLAGPPTSWYGDLRRYREHAKGAGIPLGIYRQTFHSVQDYNNTVYRDPSPSELRLNTFAALAFNVKYLTDFVYNTGAASLFTKTFNGSGDTLINPTNGLYAEMTDINKRARNLGRALMQLTPIYDLHNTNTLTPPPGPGSDDPNFPNFTTTSIMFLRGRTISGGVTNFNPVPNSFQNDPSSTPNPAQASVLTYTWFESGKNEPYMNGFGVTNKAAVKNNGLAGDVLISWFRPLDEGLDGPTYTNQVYMMVVNGLTDPSGTAADCMQEIHLDFVGLSNAMTNLIMLDPVTGLLQTNGLPLVSSKRRLTLDLNGGDAALFKFNTGAPFVGFVTPTPALLSAHKQGNAFAISLKGAIGARYQLQATSSLSAATWSNLTSVVLTSSPYTVLDPATPGANTRYYRAVGIP